MSKITKTIQNKQYTETNNLLETEFTSILNTRFSEMKKAIAGRLTESHNSETLQKRMDKLKNTLKDAKDKFDKRTHTEAEKLKKQDKKAEHIKESINIQELTRGYLMNYYHKAEADKNAKKGSKDENDKRDYKNRKKGMRRAEIQYWDKTQPMIKYGTHVESFMITEENSEASLKLSIPLFIRMLEYAKEEAPDDMALHKVTEKMIEMMDSGAKEIALDMEDYNKIVNITEARFKIIRARIRKGKVQRRKKVSNVKGYTFRKRGSGPAKLVRMTASERRHRKLGQRRGKIKRRAKLSRMRMKMKRSLRRRKSLGLSRPVRR